MVLGIAVLALVQLQGASLGYTRRAEQLRTVTQVASAELDWLRQTEVDPLRATCQTFVPVGFGCEVETSILGFIGYDITVSAWAPGTDIAQTGPDVTLRALTTGQRYITGVEPTDGFEPEPPAGPPTESEPPSEEPADPAPCTGGQGKGKGKGNDGCS